MKFFFRFPLLLIVMLSFFVFARPVQAMNVRAGQDVTVQAGEKVDGTLVVSGNTVTVNAPVSGDLICAGENIRIDAPVSGDVICAAQSLTISKPVGGSLRVAAQNLMVESTIGRNVTSAAQTMDFGGNSVVKGEFSAFANTMNLNGDFAQGVFGGAQLLTVGGSVGRGIFVNTAHLIVSKGAKVTGDVQYTSQNQADIAMGSVTGTVVHKVSPKTVRTPVPVRPQESTQVWLTKSIGALIGQLILAAILIAILPKYVRQTLDSMGEKTGKSILSGFLLMIVIPLILIAVAITIIGIPFALLGGLVFFIFAAIGRLLAAIYLGTKLINKTAANGQQLYVPMATGVIALWIVASIPLIGGVIAAIFMWLGMGAMYAVMKQRRK